MKPKMFPYFILIEGIDGSGKDTFANFLKIEIMKRFRYEEDATLSIVGQPCFRFDNEGKIRRFIEGGEVTLPYDLMIKELTQNRILHQQYLQKYGGIKICIRGLLTDLGTLTRLYDQYPSNEYLGQKLKIDRLIIVDVSPDEAFRRIELRGVPPTWRESLEHLTFFREFFLKQSSLPIFNKKTIIKNEDIESIESAAIKIADELHAQTI